jgi:hypothetical protein
MRLFKRKKPEGERSPCPRCSQLVTDANAVACPMCGWDLGDAYQGPTSAPHGRTADTLAAPDGADDN